MSKNIFKNHTIPLLVMLVFSFHPIYAQDKIIGIWQTENNLAKVEIYENKNLIYGKIISVSDPKNNSKIGLLILKKFKPIGNTYHDGTIVEPNHNHSVNGTLELSRDGKKLVVKGKAFLGLISKSEIWTKID
ncbi:DUF2147 domain-containing protein [Flavobacterium sp.]|uniref:DUF2147 domain-containing protein n=1 Tax=Flavobacterium sp. TaxID=239 RepID=UPI0026020B7A|nr:DUF2147 domain-containing protein [Flavobacterium sp.]